MPEVFRRGKEVTEDQPPAPDKAKLKAHLDAKRKKRAEQRGGEARGGTEAKGGAEASPSKTSSGVLKAQGPKPVKVEGTEGVVPLTGGKG